MNQPFKDMPDKFEFITSQNSPTFTAVWFEEIQRYQYYINYKGEPQLSSLSKGMMNYNLYRANTRWKIVSSDYINTNITIDAFDRAMSIL